jgi:spermidine synthase
MNTILISTILLVGFSGITAQIVLLRELLITFYGNELIIGVIFANWVLWESLGVVLIARILGRVKNSLNLYSVFLLAFAIVFPVSIYLARVSKSLMGIPVGEATGLLSVFLATLGVNSVVGFLHGGLFSCALRLNTKSPGSPAPGISMVYVLETVGTLLGGIIVSFFFLGHWNSFQTASLIALAHLSAGVIISAFFLQGLTRRCLLILSISLGLFFLAVPAARMHQSSLDIQWKGVEIQEYKNSVYGNIMVTRRFGQQTVFYNGIPAVVTPLPDIASLEEFAHFPLLLHEQPKNILVINAAAGGFIHEILKHNPERLDYLELDPEVIAMLKKYPTALTAQELSDQRVRIMPVDGSFFIRTTDMKYDVVFIGVSSPVDLTMNRFFTIEFFKLLKKTVNPGAIIALRMPGSQTYFSKELLDLNSCIYHGLKSVFPSVRVIPGDLTLYCASADNKILRLSALDIMRRFDERLIRSPLISLPYLRYRFNAEAEGAFLSPLQNTTAGINHDMAPVALYYMQVLWNKQFSPALMKFFGRLRVLNMHMAAAIIFFGLISVLLFFRKKPGKLRDFSMLSCIGSTGFAGMLLNLILIFTFQVYYGYIYQWIGVLVAVFMAGAAMGSFMMTRFIKTEERSFWFLCFFEGAVIMFSLFLAFSLRENFMNSGPACVSFLIFFLISGTFVGAEFPLACRLYLKSPQDASMAGSVLYFADLAGGWGAGLLGGIFFIPILGVFKSCMLIAVLKTISLFLLIAARTKSNYSAS